MHSYSKHLYLITCRACRNGNAQIVDLLLQNGAIARPHYYTKYSPLYISCHMGNVEISRIILDVSKTKLDIEKSTQF